MRLVYLGIILAVFFHSCSTPKKVVEPKNQSSLYNPGNSYLHPEYVIFHQGEDVSQLIVKANPDELLFNQANPDNKMLANITIQYQLIDITDNPLSKDISDSASVVKKVEKPQNKRSVLFTLFMKAKFGKIYSLKVVLTDNLRNVKQQNFVPVNKLNKYSGQNFKVISLVNDMPVYQNLVAPGEAVRIITGQQDVKKLYIKYKKDDTPLPPPPFSVGVEPSYDFKEDSSWVFTYNGLQQSFLFPYKGVYLVQTDSAKTDGLLISNYGKSFPKVYEPEMMVPPLEYLTTTAEFNSLLKVENPKLAVDNFWLKLSGNVDMARELIRIYYNRMFYANLFFSGYKQGWRTDRGMIYMIFGPPSYITKNPASETWEYYVKQDASNLTITFNNILSPYTDNHYVMVRNDSYTRYWRTAVDSWRKGKAYSLEE
jgi:GWxTD domain-containing protein